MRFYRIVSCCLCIILLIISCSCCVQSKRLYNQFNGYEDLGYWWLSKVDKDLYLGDKIYHVPEYDSNGNAIEGIGVSAITNIEQIEEIIVGDHIEWISDYAISNMPNLKKVYIGKNVSSIREGLFHNCPVLETVIVHSENSYYKIENRFILSKNGKNLVRAWSNDVNIPAGVETIQSLAFARNALIESLEIPVGILHIENNAFFQCVNLKNIYIPSSVKTIERLSFIGCIDLKIYLKTDFSEIPFEEEWNIVMPPDSFAEYEIIKL